MRAWTRAAIVAMGACAMFASGTALAAPSADGMFFVHGTGDQTPPTSSASAFSPSGGSAINYWTTSSLDKMTTDPAGGQWSYGVAGYGGASYAAYDSRAWGTVADQLWNYYLYGNNGAIYDVVVVTHSNGSNPIRYLMAHPTAVTPGGNTVSTVMSVVQEVVFVAGDNRGTPLADKVTSAGTLANIANSVVGMFSNMNYNSPAVLQQVQANMTTYNGNGTFAVGTSPGGILTKYVYGTNVYASFWSGDAWCGGYPTTLGLKATQIYGWGSSSAPTDGFIGVNSSTYVGQAGMGGDSRLNHNQSRLSCHGVGGTIASLAHGALDGTFNSIPPDYTISPAAQACNATTQGWDSTGTYYWYGCTSSMQSSSTEQDDCYVSYGGSAGYTATWTGVNPQNADGYTPSDGFYDTGYSNAGNYYSEGSSGCSDSWLGDGTCDLCLIAKYGFDSAPGSTNNDDCANLGSGTSNTCYDLAYDSTVGATNYVGYTATH